MRGVSKAIGGGLAGAVTVILIWLLTDFVNVEVPLVVQGAIATVIGYGLTWVAPKNAERRGEINMGSEG